MTQITFLGVGGAMAQAPADNHTAFLVRTNTSTILLDSGPSIMRQLELAGVGVEELSHIYICLLYTSPSPRDRTRSRMPSSA